MKIVDVKPHHIDEIESIENDCFPLPWKRRDLENQMNADNCIFLAAVDDNDSVMGYVGLMFVLDEGYISNIAVAPEYRRRGIAGSLIKALVERTKNKLAFLTLEVRESNAPAISLYKKHGFKAVGLRKNYYEKPKENALLMTLFFDREEA
ncbi:MAG: ribosomal protein S18-alanine N-acetyltransferase [Oscillospiraceae bacterium]|jgi:ribosomal-protein-alanine N-acetyltransferase